MRLKQPCYCGQCVTFTVTSTYAAVGAMAVAVDGNIGK
jgi:hypothetical protein